MAGLEMFLPQVRAAFPTVPYILMREAVRNAADEFCRRTRLIQVRVPVSVVADNATAAVTITGARAFEVMNLWREDRELNKSNVVDILARWPSKGYPREYALDGDGRLLFWPEPAVDETLQANAVFAPGLDATELPDALRDDWRDTIAAGARLRLGRDYAPFRNDEQALIGAGIFERGIERAIQRRSQGGTGRPLRSRAGWY